MTITPLERIIGDEIVKNISDEAKEKIVDEYVLSQLEGYMFNANVKNIVQTYIIALVEVELNKDENINIIKSTIHDVIHEKIENNDYITRLAKKIMLRKTANQILRQL